ncbi:ABC transporter permease [Thioclava dalianensis]|uniref:TRAP transporter small permease protein n=1 Tax=Thioclava dalianensis TaxID=1185766 RepID=A0A074TKB4_9RHOB|nr:TRAP transporter small permease [Thioclava dalianensis]KEP69428.1 ABC transporter permease [Thioclava dalianensis]SFN02915.1 TRAP-type C4-dicarboxylate transport system, small permease component [Thioclava dalianensis]
MQKFTKFFFRTLDIVLALLLAGMALMVFLNVILRYAFDSGIVVSEELSRFFFVWLTFIGAVVAHHHHMHMGMETVVAAFGRRGRKVLMGLSEVVIIGCSAVLLIGTWKQLPINMTMAAPVTMMPMGFVYGSGLFTAAGIIAISLERLFRLLTGRMSDAEFDRFAGQHHDADETEGRAS